MIAAKTAIALLTAIFLVVTPKTGAEGVSPIDTADDNEQRVYDLIADYNADWHEIVGRYAVMLDGEVIITDDREHPFIPALTQERKTHFQVFDQSKRFKLTGHPLVYHRDRTLGAETLVKAGRIFVRKDEEMLVSKHREIERDLIEEEGPFVGARQCFTGFGAFIRGWNRWDQCYGETPGLHPISGLLAADLVSTKSMGGGYLYARFETSMETLKAVLHEEVIFSEADGGYPVRTRGWFYDLIRKRMDSPYETKSRWTKAAGGRRLPNRIEILQGNANTSEPNTEHTYEIRWLIGEEVPEAIFTAEDPLRETYKAFGVPLSKPAPGGGEHFIVRPVTDELHANPIVGPEFPAGSGPPKPPPPGILGETR